MPRVNELGDPPSVGQELCADLPTAFAAVTQHSYTADTELSKAILLPEHVSVLAVPIEYAANAGAANAR
jgi:hypothetical protein